MGTRVLKSHDFNTILHIIAKRKPNFNYILSNGYEKSQES